MMTFRNTALLLIFFVLFSCKTTNEITYTNLAATYDADTNLKIEGYRVFHENDSISRVYLSYSTAALKYIQPPGKDYFRSNYSFSYKLFDDYESSKILDENVFVMSDSLFYKKPEVLNLEFAVKAYSSGTYLLEIRFNDLNADNSILYPIKLDKQNLNKSQNFLPRDEDGKIILNNWISWKDRFTLEIRNHDIDKLYVNYYNLDFPYAAPPFSQARPLVYDNSPENTFSIKVENGVTQPMQFAGEGFYQFRSDTSANHGITLFRFHDYYPDLRKPELLAPPLRYLTSNKEFEKLMNAPDIKMAVDSFWIETAGSEERAKELIENYYARVIDANRFFTSHKEGWKTDRGMIYIIFGKPRMVYRRTDIETWIYGEQGNRVYQTFDFIRAINPFTTNDYELQRDPDYKAQWYNAILYWRQ